ncbi:HIT-like protein [Corynespora cassiicola Philippines]|uniref:HIT-like protein n=1 Tax=Corynespora cassiicola Philippines TaxID=1448308 RepID=A0A2T2NCQ6_CORCC|nr:HIT-like protein [Corynespora cassiicola Philippines]
MKMLLGLSEALPSLVGAKFSSAKATKSLIFSPTELAIIRTSTGIPFQLRYCPSLAKKPQPKKEPPNPDHGGLPPKKFDPFDNPPADLHIADIPQRPDPPPTHLLVLNKFPIIPQHFILATKANKPQTHALEADDLAAAHACLRAWTAADPQRRLFAFFNSGECSGASQPHRHLQFLPEESMRDGDGDGGGWTLLLDLILAQQGRGLSLPCAHFAVALPEEPSAEQLQSAYAKLYTAAVAASVAAGVLPASATPAMEGELPLSYNLALTLSGMAIIPRRAEGCMLRRDDGTEVGFVALNGTVLGGTLMVKGQEEWEYLRGGEGRLDKVLAGIGVPWKGEGASL